MKTSKAKLKKARDLAVSEARGPHRLGKLLGISGQAVSQWEVIPEARVPKIAKITGIPAYKLRPDIFKEPPSAN